MANLTIQLKGGKALQAKLKRLENPSAAMKRGMDNYMADIDDELKTYAPATEANRPPGPNNYSWYKRRFGTVTRTGRKYKTSQDMANKWNIKVRALKSVVRTRIKNLATYSPFVIGDKQTGFHGRRGWKVVRDIVERTKGDALDRIGEEVDKELKR